MSKGQTSSDDTGYKRGEKGFARSADQGQYTGENYKKELLKVDAVGQRAQVGDGSKLKQRDY